MKITQKITPFFWFDKEAKQAAEFYVSVFGKESKINSSTALLDTPSGPGTGVISVTLAGQEFSFLNGGPALKINDGISFIINCEDQAKVDYFWSKLSAVKEAEQCGWLKDRFGVTWQVVPVRLKELLADKDRAKAARVTEAMLKMKKLEIDKLEKA